MEFLLNGILLGLSLSMLVGPLVIALVQTSLSEGVPAGLTVGFGIWVSDLAFIIATYLGLSYIQQMVSWEGFEPTMGVAGGIILIVFGLGVFLSSSKKTFETEIAIRRSSVWSLLLKGFLINTINPFTVFVWTGVAGNLIAAAEKEGWAMLFYVGVLGTIILTDSLKVFFAKWVRKWLKPKVVHRIQQVAGIALLLLGVGLMLRVLFT
jgi:threonine/homoserine/homoserine lactone efflux protein